MDEAGIAVSVVELIDNAIDQAKIAPEIVYEAVMNQVFFDTCLPTA